MQMVLLLALAILAAGPAHGQSASSRCGALADKEEMLQDFARYFVDDEYAGTRGTVISQVSTTDPQYVLADSIQCQAVRQRAVTQLQLNGGQWINTQDGAYEFAVFRYGPYYAILVEEVETSTELTTGWSPLLIFRISDLEFLKIIAT